MPSPPVSRLQLAEAVTCAADHERFATADRNEGRQQLRLDKPDAEIGQPKIGIRRKVAPEREQVLPKVVEERRGVVVGGHRAAPLEPLVEDHHLGPGPRKVGGARQPVRPGADDEDVVLFSCHRAHLLAVAAASSSGSSSRSMFSRNHATGRAFHHG